MNTVDHLMQPRYEVIAKVPLSRHKVGDIIHGDGDWYSTHRSQVDVSCSAYPDVYRLLSWWEHRKESEMPEYVKIEDKVIKVKKWLIEDNSVWLNVQYPEPSFTMGSKFYPEVLPATPADHLQYINKK